MKRSNQAASCTLKYDKLVVDNRVYIWNDIQGKVLEQVQDEEVNGNSLCPCSRPASVMTDIGLGSSINLRSPMKTSKKVYNRTQSLFNPNDEDVEETIKDQELKIRELEHIIAKQADVMKDMRNQLDNIKNDKNGSVDSLLSS